MLPGFPKAITRGAITAGHPTGDGESSPVLADLDGDNRNELIVAGSRRLRARDRAATAPSCPAGRCAATRPPPVTPASARSRAARCRRNVGGAILGLGRGGRHQPRRRPRGLRRRHGGQRLRLGRRRQPVLHARVRTRRSRASRSSRSSNCATPRPVQHRTQHGFIALARCSPTSTATGKMEIDRRRHGPPPLRLAPRRQPGRRVPGAGRRPAKVPSVDPQTDAGDLQVRLGLATSRARSSTRPRSATSNGDGKPEIVVGTNEEYAAASDGGWNAAPANSSSFNLLDQLGQGVDAFSSRACGAICDNIPDVPLNRRTPASTRSRPTATTTAGGPFLPGWPAKIGDRRRRASARSSARASPATR